MRKFSFKKLTAVILSAAGASALAAGAAGCMPKSSDLTEPENIEITRLAPPDDGSLPTAHTCAENMAYLAYVFDGQTQYHSYSYGVTNASIATQTTRTFRDFKDGILLTTDLTHSSMVKSGSQTCTVFNENGEGEVYFRTSKAPDADTLPAQAVWSEEAPTYFSERAYHYTYGLLPTELFNYIVNEQNIVESEQVKENADGTYTQNFALDPKASTYFYQFGMKTRGGLSGYPEFERIAFSVTFDADWRILSTNVHEVAKVNKGIVVTSISDFTVEYSYGEDGFDAAHFSYYDDYFKKYLGDDNLEQGGATDDKPIMDVTNVLSNGFSQIMNGGAQFEITADLGVNRYTGYVFVALDLADPLETLVLKLSLGKTLQEQTLYVEYGNGEMAAYYGKDFALSANLAEVKLAVEQLGKTIEKISNAFAGGSSEGAPLPEGTGNGSDPVSELMNAMALTAGEKQAVLTLDTDDLLGMGIGVKANLVFGINGNEITFRGGTVGDLSMGGEKVDLALTVLTTTAPEIHRENTRATADLSEYIADINSLLGADLLKISLNLNGSDEKVNIGALKGVNANVTAYADLDGVTVGAQAEVSYTYCGNTVSAKAEIYYCYDPLKGDYGSAIIRLTEFNGSPREFALKCDIKEIAEAVGTLLQFSGAEAGGATDGLVSILNGALSADFSSLLTELYADKASIRVGVSVDCLLEMLNIDAGVRFGSCTLGYERGAGVYGGRLFALLPALGFSLEVTGEQGAVEIPESQNCLDLIYLVEDVKNLVSADLLKAEILLDGSAEGVAIPQLSGLKAGLNVYFNLQNIAVAADADISYTYNGQTVCAKFTAWYGNDELLLSLTQINGVAVNANVGCRVDELTEAVTQLLNYAGVKLSPFGDAETGGAGDVIANVLGADFNKLLPVMETDADGLRIALDADELIKLFGADLSVNLGRINLAYDRLGENKFVAAAPALGLKVNLNGADGNIEKPSATDVFDLSKLVTLVNSAWVQVDKIIDGQSVGFEIMQGETYLSLDGITVDLWGSGEVGWQKGREYVALDLCAAITETGTDALSLKLLYDKNAVDTPLVRLAINGVGIDIYREDIDGVTAGFNDIYNKIAPLLGLGGKSAEQALAEEITAVETSSTDGLMTAVFGLLASDKWVDFLNDFTLTTDGKSLALKYLSDNAVNIEIGADGDLSLYYNGRLGNRFSFGGGIVATSVTGSLTEVVNSKLESCKMSSSKDEGSAGFVKLAYDFLFEAVSNISVSNILGSDTYAVKFKLNGDNSNVPELAGIYISADIYVTGEQGEQGKLAEADLNIDAAGVSVKLNVITERRGGTTYFYINLSQIAQIKLPDLKLVATQDSLFDTFKVLVSAINDTDIVEALGALINKGGENTAPAETQTKPTVTEEQTDKLVGLLVKLFDFNFSSAVTATETDGVTTATIDLDNIVKQLGINAGALGTVEAVIDHNTHAIKTSGKTLITDKDGVSSLKEWLSLSSEKTHRRDYSDFERKDYISIEFLPTLLDDLIKFATDENGKLHDKFTLSGNIKANLVGMIDVNIDPFTLTVDIGESGLSVSAVMHVNKAKVIGIGIPESTVGLTYANGLLTLAKGLDGSSPEYKVMTFDYFLDHMLTKNDSVLKWLLDISGWDLIMSFLTVDVGSGLTSPEDIYLYKATSVKEEQEISMYDYVDALRVIIDGVQTASFGNGIADLESTLGVYDNYYGFALNAGAVTNGVLTKLYAAITRGAEGISGVKASGAVQSYVNFSVDLAYREGWTQAYTLGASLQEGVTAVNLYDNALQIAADNNYNVDFDYFVKKPGAGYDEKFGCLSVLNGGSGYTLSTEYSNILYSHELTVIGLDGQKEIRNVRHGSTIYLYDNDSPLYTDTNKSHRIIYSLSPDSAGGTQVTMNGDLTVYALTRKAVNVIVHSGGEEYTVTTFEGADMPLTVTGLETVSTPVYEDGSPVTAGDKVSGLQSQIHIYGVFVKSETVVNYVKYRFDGATLSYTAVGKAAGFNDYYSVKGNTLVLENTIGGYPVTALGAEAFANTEGKPIKKVVVPENITSVGEKAFFNNTDMQSIVFLAETVDFKGDDSNGTFAFYGCNLSSNEEKTQLIIYYNKVTANGGESNLWSHFFTAKAAGISYYKYIGIDPNTSEWINYHENGGGALYGAGGWQYAECGVTVDLNGAEGGKLNAKAVEATLSRYFPYVTAGEYSGSAYEDTVNKALEATLASMDYTSGGITYKCVYGVSQSVEGAKVVLTFNVSYQKAAEVYVRSAVDFTVYGVQVKAGVLTKITVPVEGDNISLATPSLDTHDFNGWRTSVENGVTVYNADWTAKEFNLKIRLTRGGTDTNIVHVNSQSIKISGGVVSGTTDVTTVKIYGGNATFTLSDKVLTIVSGDVIYTVYVNEASIFGSDKNIKRNITCDVSGAVTVNGDMVVTIAY